MSYIYIFAIPPGFASEHIRQEWVGIQIPLAPPEEVKANPPVAGTGENGDGYLVRRCDAIQALLIAGRREAANFWQSLPLGHYLVFSKRVCRMHLSL